MTGQGSGRLTGADRGMALLLQRAFAVGLLVAAVVALVTPLNGWLVFPPVVVRVAAGVSLLVLVLLGRSLLRSGAGVGGGEARSGTLWAGAAAGTLLAGAHAVLALIPFGWDARRIFSSASTLAVGEPLPAEALTYYARYPHNVRLLWLEQVAVEAGSVVSLPALGAVLLPHVLCVGVVLWSLGRAAQLLGHPRAVLPVQALALVLVGLSPNVAVPYTDLPAAAAVSVAALAMVRCGGAAGWSWPWALTGAVSLGLGVALKPYVVVLAIALVLVVLWSRQWRRVVAVALLGAVSWGTVALLDVASARGTGLDAQRLAQVEAPFPPEHFLAMGTWDSAQDSPVRRWGAYRRDQVDATAAMDPATRAADLRAQAWDQVGGRGLVGNLRFVGAKALWVWGDGTFWAHGEGADSRQASSLPESLSGMTAASRGAGELYDERAGVVQGLWVAVVLLTGAVLLRARADPLLTTWALALGGLTAYLLIFEARPRYVLALVPVVLLVLLRAGLGSADHPTATREAR
ncbi:hypothetical protein [Serinicoccus marinus]|uniref:hypothetical protein n=1 Tax=Serinicoccus marinus TaxID=247333 RepID=UPI002492B606|nr:hypothetical protein [Serinicoccus marinus]